MILPVGKTGENITSSYMTMSLPWMSLWDVGWISFSCACVLSWSVPVGTSLCIFSVHPSKGQRVEEKKMVSPAAGFALPAGGQVLLPVVSPSFPSSQGPRHLMDVSLFFIFTPPPPATAPASFLPTVTYTAFTKPAALWVRGDESGDAAGVRTLSFLQWIGKEISSV